MEKGHAAAVKEMLNFAYHERCELGEKFSFLDLCCGNGWVVRQVAENGLCKRAVGVDGAQQMIFNADSMEIVDAWHKAGLDNGGIAIEDPPGLRTQDRFSFYLAYLLDPAGNKICAMNVSYTNSNYLVIIND